MRSGGCEDSASGDGIDEVIGDDVGIIGVCEGIDDGVEEGENNGVGVDDKVGVGVNNGVGVDDKVGVDEDDGVVVEDGVFL